MPSATMSEVMLTPKLRLAFDAFDSLEQQAKRRNVPIDTVITERLNACHAHTARQGLYLNDEQRQQLNHLVSENLTNPTELLRAVRRVTDIKVGGANIEIPPDLGERLRSRHVDGSVFNQWLAAMVLRKLEEEVGMR